MSSRKDSAPTYTNRGKPGPENVPAHEKEKTDKNSKTEKEPLNYEPYLKSVSKVPPVETQAKTRGDDDKPVGDHSKILLEKATTSQHCMESKVEKLESKLEEVSKQLKEVLRQVLCPKKLPPSRLIENVGKHVETIPEEVFYVDDPVETWLHLSKQTDTIDDPKIVWVASESNNLRTVYP